ADACCPIRYGEALVKICHSYANAEEEVGQRITIIESCWIQARLQIDVILSIQNVLDPEHLRVQDDLFGILGSKLSIAVVKVEKVMKNDSDIRPGLLGIRSRVNKLKYAVWAKDSLDEVIKSLEEWQRRASPSWFLILRIADPLIDKELRNIAEDVRDTLRSEPEQAISIFLSPPPEQQPLEYMDIPFCTARAARFTHRIGRDRQWLIIDRLKCRRGTNIRELKQDVRSLARKLTRSDALTFGLLNCKGVMAILEAPHSRAIRSFDFVFRIPDGMEILQSLRQLLLNQEANLTLAIRIQIAKEIAKSVNYVHMFNFVHKNIRPESLLCFEDPRGEKSSTFLVGFDSFRNVDGSTWLISDSRWEKNLYRHPSRQGEFPEDAYHMQHDIYSLGVCLLEIGLWESFVSYTTDASPRPIYGEPFKRFQTWLEVSNQSVARSTNREANTGIIASMLKEYLTMLAREKLSLTMGDRYAKAVMTCLTCLDESNEDFGYDSGVLDNDGALVGVRFVDKILSTLNEISV
ncbi:hypothetical protein GQ53DRAFT_639805, partial [Thozetella sp. PMI_491]